MTAPGFVVWFTGLSGAGKSTLATLLAAELGARGAHVEVLDGDEVRAHLTKGLGFSREDRDTNVRRIGYVARLLARAGAVAITAAISPYRATRDEQRAAAPRFLEVYCRCPVDALAARDPKGLYKKALAGELKGFTGVDDPYEEPEQADVVVDTGSQSIDACLQAILRVIEERGYLARAVAPRAVARARDRVHAGPAVSAPVARVRLGSEDWAIAMGVEFGTLAPLRGPLGPRDATKLAKEGRLESGLAWPVPWQLALPVGLACAPGDTVELSGPEDRVAVLHVTESWPDERGILHVAGELAPPAHRGLDALLARRGALEDAAGFVVRGPLDGRHDRLFDVALEARGRLLLLVPSHDEAVRGAAEAVASTRGLEEAVLVEPIPRLPKVDPRHDALLQVVVLRNVGVGAAVLEASPAGPAPRAALASLRAAELGLEVVAAGPVDVSPIHGPFTRRMRAR